MAASVMKVSEMSLMSTVRPASAAGPATVDAVGLVARRVQPMHSSTSRKRDVALQAALAAQPDDLDAAAGDGRGGEEVRGRGGVRLDVVGSRLA